MSVEEKLRKEPESKRTAVLAWILAGSFAVATLVLGILLFGAKQKMLLLEEDMAAKMREVQEMAAASAAAADMQLEAAERKETVRLYNGQVQVCENNVWKDICSIEEFRQSDPIEIGRQRMRDIVSANREAFANGTLAPEAYTMLALYAEDGKAEIKPVTAAVDAGPKDSAQAGGNKKPSSDGGSQAGNPAADNSGGSAAANQDAPDNSGSGDSYDDIDDDDDDDSSDSGDTDSEPDTGGDDSAAEGDAGASEEDSGDGENIGWTDEVL